MASSISSRRVVAILLGNRASTEGRSLTKGLLELAAKRADLNLSILSSTQGRLDAQKLKRLRGASPVAVLLIGQNNEVLRACQEVRRAGERCPLFGRLRQASSDFIETMKGRVTGFWAPTAAGHETFPPCEPSFAKAFQQRYDRYPSSWAALAYDGVMLIQRAVEVSSRKGLSPSRALGDLPLFYGVGFVFNFKDSELWHPALSKFDDQAQFSTMRPPDRILPLKTWEIERLKSKASNSSSNDEAGDKTLKKWHHFLVLPAN